MVSPKSANFVDEMRPAPSINEAGCRNKIKRGNLHDAVPVLSDTEHSGPFVVDDLVDCEQTAAALKMPGPADKILERYKGVSLDELLTEFIAEQQEATKAEVTDDFIQRHLSETHQPIDDKLARLQKRTEKLLSKLDR